MSYIEINELLMKLHLIPSDKDGKSSATSTKADSDDSCCTDPDVKNQSAKAMSGAFNALQSGNIPSVKSTKR